MTSTESKKYSSKDKGILFAVSLVVVLAALSLYNDFRLSRLDDKARLIPGDVANYPVLGKFSFGARWETYSEKLGGVEIISIHDKVKKTEETIVKYNK